MIKQSLLSLALGVAVVSVTVHVQAAQDKEASEPTSKQYQSKVNKQEGNQQDPVTRDPDHPSFEMEEGGRAPRKFIRDDYVIKDWKAHGLQQPGEDSQWVKIGTDYVLIKRSNAVIEKIVKAK